MDTLQASRIVGGNSAYGRAKSDFYPTPPEVTQALLNFLDIPKTETIWEPACGENHMLNVIRKNGYTAIGTDILNGQDFLTTDIPGDVSWIITNPPFSKAEDFIKRCISLNKPFALLLKAHFWNAKRRIGLFKERKPTYILPLTWRPDFFFKERGSGSPLLDVMWCVWSNMNPDTTMFLPLEKPNKG